MTTHVAHPDVHVHGLYPGCARCEDLAVHPDQLDDILQQRLLHGRLNNHLEAIAAKMLRESSPHEYHLGELVPSLCYLCGQPMSDPRHGGAP